MMRSAAILCIVLCSSFRVEAQQQDAVLSGAVQLEKKWNRTFSNTMYMQGALTENYTEPGFGIWDIGTQIRLSTRWSVGVNYRRTAVRTLENTFAPRQFWYGDVNYTYRWNALSLNVRSRYVTKKYSGTLLDGENYRDDRHYLRNRLLVRYDVNYHNDIFIAYEQVYRLDERNETELHRYMMGYAYTFNMHHKLQCTYTIAAQDNRSDPGTDFISGVTYFYRF